MSEDLRALAHDRTRRRRNFHTHAIAHLIGGLFIFVVWAATEYHNAAAGRPASAPSASDRRHEDEAPLLAGTAAAPAVSSLAANHHRWELLWLPGIVAGAAWQRR